jgi:pilus assembly protein CpaD
MRSQRSQRGPIGLLLAVLAAAPLSACHDSRGEQGWTPPGVASEPIVEATEYRHDVPFAPGSSLLGGAADASLRQFLNGVNLGPDDHVIVFAPLRTLGERPEQGLLDQRRQAAVIRSLATLGVTGRSAWVRASELDPQGIPVVVRRMVVNLPECPDWTAEPGANADNRPLRSWSCTTAVNLGLMVADPYDLIRGREPGNADGEYLARSVRDYRRGRTRDLIRDAASGELFPSVAPSSTSSNSVD